MTASINNWNKLDTSFSTYASDAASGAGGPAAFAAGSKTLRAQIDTMGKAGAITAGQKTQMLSDVDAMDHAAGASNGTEEWNAAVGDFSNMLTTANQTGNPHAATNAEMDLGKLEGQSAVNKLVGDGSTDFAKSAPLKKYASMTPSGQADAMNKDGWHLYQSGNGDTLMYNNKTRQGFGFDGNGKSIDSGNMAKKGMGEQNGTFTQKIGSLSVTFGSGGVDSKGHLYGVSVVAS